MSLFEEFHRTGGFDPRLNKSFIALLLKTECNVSLDEFKPNSLVECLYKVITKVFASRLPHVIGDLIGEIQFSFVKGREILDCSLLA